MLDKEFYKKYLPFYIVINLYGDYPVENLNLYVVIGASSGTSFSGTRSSIV